ncbi:hypothetical protein BH23ACT9_BH23ACT9_17730 [soil metagenome]
MGFLSGIWSGLKDGLEIILRFYEGLLSPLPGIGVWSWGLAIILLTVTVRVFMIPLMVKQTKSMRAMQTLQPELKKIQEKYKADRSMMKTDPERYKKLKEKQREAQMALYSEHKVNPVGGCLPLLLQMPIFLALFQVLQSDEELAVELGNASFLGFQSLTDTAQSILTGGAGGFVLTAAISAVVLIVLQVGTTFWSQKQMMARNTQAASEQAQAQKIMLYVMPGFLGVLSYSFPIGVVLYWVTTNFWTMGQQAVIFRGVAKAEAKAAEEREEAKRQKAQRKHVEDVTGDDEPEAKTPKPQAPKPQAPKPSSSRDDRGATGSQGRAGSRPEAGTTRRSREGGSAGSRARNGSNGADGAPKRADNSSRAERTRRRAQANDAGGGSGASTSNGPTSNGSTANGASSKDATTSEGKPSAPGSR